MLSRLPVPGQSAIPHACLTEQVRDACLAEYICAPEDASASSACEQESRHVLQINNFRMTGHVKADFSRLCVLGWIIMCVIGCRQRLKPFPQLSPPSCEFPGTHSHVCFHSSLAFWKGCSFSSVLPPKFCKAVKADYL